LLEHELKEKDQALLHSHQELQSSTEELRSSNEEMQSVNEELQSTNEELETSKEELQSVNEELATVNNELNTKVLDLSRVNNDMNNLLAGTGIATVFVDHQLNIMRFTPSAAQIINLAKSDIGRPVGHFTSDLVGYTSLLEDTQSVLDTLHPKDLEVKTTSGMYYMMRIRPYRTMDNIIEGAVITFVDISEMISLKEKLERMSTVILDAHDAITMQDLEGRITAWNPAATKLYGWTEAEALSMNVRDRIPPEIREDSIAKLVQLSKSEVLEPYNTKRITKSGKVIEVWMTATALMNKTHQMYAIATTERAKVETSNE
jgi:two-component system CheB/CheR fusion protein